MWTGKTSGYMLAPDWTRWEIRTLIYLPFQASAKCDWLSFSGNPGWWVRVHHPDFLYLIKTCFKFGSKIVVMILFLTSGIDTSPESLLSQLLSSPPCEQSYLAVNWALNVAAFTPHSLRNFYKESKQNNSKTIIFVKRGHHGPHLASKQYTQPRRPLSKRIP